MPGIDELLRAEGERWRDEVDAHVDSYPEPAEARSRRPWSTTRGKVWTASLGAVAAAAVAVLAVGLTSGSGSNSTFTANADSAGGRVAATVPAPAASSVNGAPLSAGKLAPSLNPAGTAPVASASLILTGSVSLTVADNAAVSRAATRATGIADGAGGRVDADSRSTSGGRATSSATLVLRIPNAALPAVRTQLATLGTVRSQDLQTKDVTTQVADVNSRVTSARAAIAGLTRLYAKARTVGELIAVESALTARQSDLEALEAQQRTLTAQTALATLTVSIDVRAKPATTHHSHRNGFVSGLHHGWDAFTATLRAIATALGAVLPFAGVLLVLAATGIVALRRRRSRRPASAVDPSP